MVHSPRCASCAVDSTFSSSTLPGVNFRYHRKPLKQFDVDGHGETSNRDGIMSRSFWFWEQLAINDFLLRLFGRYYRQMRMTHKEPEPY